MRQRKDAKLRQAVTNKCLNLFQSEPLVVAMQEARTWTEEHEEATNHEGRLRIIGTDNKVGLRFGLNRTAAQWLMPLPVLQGERCFS